MARLRSWWQKTSKPLDAVIVTVLVVLLALLVVIILGYSFNWSWTGFQRRTLYDWLQLLIIPAVLAVGGYLFNYTTSRNEQKATQLRDQTERDIALDNQRETALQAYIDSMSELLLERNLRESGADDEVRKIARVRTLTVLPRLDGRRKRSVIQFLYESDLIKRDSSVINLDGADLRRADFNEAIVRAANLNGADLSGADLQRANLRGTDLSRTNLRGTDLRASNLRHTDMRDANLSGSDLSGSILREAVLFSAELTRANLSGANLVEADLRTADLREADLTGADLFGADLRETNVSAEQLDKARSLEGATMPDGTKHA